jgi:hypothetical protein
VNSLIYVEKKLIVPIGAKLIGSSLTAGKATTGTSGFNWFLAASVQISSERGVETRIAELFPEDVFHYVYGKIQNSQLTVRKLCEDATSGSLKSADVVSVVGELRIPGVNIAAYNPFSPPDIKLPATYRVYGEQCMIAEVHADAYVLPVFFLADAKETVCYANGKPVEVVGVLKWSPSYDVGGFAVNQILLGAALLLRK